MMLSNRACHFSIFLSFLSTLWLVPVGAQETQSEDAKTTDVELVDVNKPEAKFQVDGEQIKGYIDWLADDKREGRGTFSQGYQKAAEWAAVHFKQWGLEPAGEKSTYYQDVPIKRTRVYQIGMPELKIGSQEYLVAEDDFVVEDTSTAGTTVSAEVVFVGYGISAPDHGLDEYADVNVTDKICLILKGSPAAPEKETDEDPWEDYSSDEAKIWTAYEKKAAAVFLYENRSEEQQEREQKRRESKASDSSDKKEALKFERKFLVFTIQGRVLRAIMKTDRQESLRGFNRRLARITKNLRDQKPQSQATKVTVRIKGYERIEEFHEEEEKMDQNVLAKIPGTDPELKDQYVIMGGHLDHLGVRAGYIYNGADDDASGTAVVMEVARVLSEGGFKPKRTLVFCCWTGEEFGLLGSTHYVEHPCDGVAIDKVVAYLNADMVGLGKEINAPGALNFPSIWEVIKRNQDKDILARVKPSTGGPGGSDFAPFIKKGIESLALMTYPRSDHPDYHTPEDDAAKMEPELLRQTGQFMLQGAVNLANETKANLIIEDRQVQYDAMRYRIQILNPDLDGGYWKREKIDGSNQDKLRWRIVSIEEKPTQDQRQRDQKGINELRVFEGDVELLLVAADALGFTRVDIEGSDGVWIKKGRLTRDGRYAVGMMEEHKIVINLVSPHPELVDAMLDIATRPFVITGFYLLEDKHRDLINEKKILIGIKFDPRDVDACVKRLEEARAALGDTDNLILIVTASDGLEEAEKDLYKKLIGKGWQADEIGSDSWRPNKGIAGGNLRVLE
jgi:hypothetical protein